MYRSIVLFSVFIILLRDVNAIFNISAYWRSSHLKNNHNHDDKEKIKNDGYFEKLIHFQGRPLISSNKHHLGKHYVVDEHYVEHQERDPHYAHRYAPGTQHHQQNVGVVGHHHGYVYVEEPHQNTYTSVPHRHQQEEEYIIAAPHYHQDESNRPIVIGDVVYEVPPYEPIRIDDSFAELTGISTENPNIYDFVQNKPQPEVVENNQFAPQYDDKAHYHHQQHLQVEVKPQEKPEHHNIQHIINNELKHIEDNINFSGGDQALEIIVDVSPFTHKTRYQVKGHDHHKDHHEHHDHHDHHVHHDHHDHHKKRHHKVHHKHHHRDHDHHHSHNHPKMHYHKPTHHYHHHPTHNRNIFQKGKSFSETYFRQWHK